MKMRDAVRAEFNRELAVHEICCSALSVTAACRTWRFLVANGDGGN